MANKDNVLLKGINTKAKSLVEKWESNLNATGIGHPLDIDILKALTKVEIKDDDDDYQIFKYLNEINCIWKLIIEKSIKCLRYFDTREPFLTKPTKKPIAYGVNELGNYFDRYIEFEKMLYGGGKYYRDHVIHVFRTWILGIDCLLENNGKYLGKISVGDKIKVNELEKLSIWSIIALTHDLGYPLEKSQEIIDKTKEMMKSFIVNPIVSLDLSFNGVQNNMNDFVVRFLSSKMHGKAKKCPKESAVTEPKSNFSKETEEAEFVARLQPKYYFKFQKSLEKTKHGIISAIIIYKLLLYFLESDYSVNEDYTFGKEDARQFYIRREILRAIAAHTCHDIYHLDMLNFAYLLIIVDDCQEWGRKKINELYVKSRTKYEFDEIYPQFDVDTIEIKEGEKINLHKCKVSEQFTLPEDDIEGLKRLLKSILEQSDNYREIFRDGQDTTKRNFSFEKKCTINYETDKKVVFEVNFIISNGEGSTFKISVPETPNQELNKMFDLTFMKKVYKDSVVTSEIGPDARTIYNIAQKLHITG